MHFLYLFTDTVMSCSECSLTTHQIGGLIAPPMLSLYVYGAYLSFLYQRSLMSQSKW